MQLLTDGVEIRSVEQLHQLPNFCLNRSFTEADFVDVVASYDIPEKQSCRLIKPGNLNCCNQPHNIGYVVVLNNGDLTIVGKDCVLKFAGLDELKARIIKYRDEQQRVQLYNDVIKKANCQNFDPNEVNKALNRINSVENKISLLTKNISKRGKNLFSECVKLRAGRIIATFVYYDLDNEGHRINEHKQQETIAKLQGIEVFRITDNLAARKLCNEIKDGLVKLQSISSKSPRKLLKEISNALSGYNEFIEKSYSYETSLTNFLNNDAIFSSFLCYEFEDQTRFLVSFISLKGNEIPHKEASDEITKLYSRMKKERKAKSIYFE